MAGRGRPAAGAVEILGKTADGEPLAVRSLTPELWPALEDLFGPRGPRSGCWCQYFRIGPRYRKRPAEGNRADLRAEVEGGPPPGMLAFAGELAVGWCRLTPREAAPWLGRNWRLAPVDERPVWSLTCIYVRKGWRRRGVSEALIDAALVVAERAGAETVEAYPFDARVSPSASGTGYASSFERAGFRTVARRTPARPILRHDLKGRERRATREG